MMADKIVLFETLVFSLDAKKKKHYDAKEFRSEKRMYGTKHE